MKHVMVWAGAEQTGLAIARRMGFGMKVVVGDKSLANAQLTAKEVANVAELVMGPQGAFITGSDFLIDGATASYHYGPLKPEGK